MKNQKEEELKLLLTPIIKDIIQEHFKHVNTDVVLKGDSFIKKFIKLVCNFFNDDDLQDNSKYQSLSTLDKGIEWLQGQQVVPNNLDIKKATKINAINTFFVNTVFNYEKSFLEAKKIVIQFEGLSLKAYKCPAEIWTIGYGNTSYLKSFADQSNQKITKQKAEELLQKDLKYFFDIICKKLDTKCSEYQIAAVTSFAFNVGLGAFLRSALLKTVLNNPLDYDGVKKQFLKWVYIKKIKSEGLLRRRQCEFDLYSTKNLQLNPQLNN